MNWINARNAKTGNDIFINLDHVVSIEPALQAGKAYCYVKFSDGSSIVTDESFDELYSDICEFLEK